MSYFPNEETDISYALDKSVHYSWVVLKKIIPLIFFITLIEGFATYVNPFVHSLLAYYFCLLIESLVFLFFLGAMLYQSHSILQQQAVSTIDACRVMLKRMIPVCITFIVFLVIIIAYYLLFSHIMHAMSKGVHTLQFSSTIFFLFSMALLMVFIVFFLFSLPLIVLEGLSPLAAIGQSYKLSKSRPAQIFTVYAGMAFLAMAVFPNTQHAHFFMHNHVWMLFDFIVYCALLPFILNYMLFILNDLNIRSQHLE